MGNSQKPDANSAWNKKTANGTSNRIDEAIEESFPASDAPAWTPATKHTTSDETTKITLAWQSNTQDFLYETYNRDAKLTFGGGDSIMVSNSSLYYGDSRFANSEELFLASVAFCYMHTLLAIASKQRYNIKSYTDKPIALLGNNDRGAMCVAEVQLNPEIIFEQLPSQEQIDRLQASAHHHCFIANSICSKFTINIHARSV